MVGLFSESDSSKLVGTARMLLRSKMLDGRLEIERYDALPQRSKAVIKENCDVELNRMALDDGMKGKRCALLLYRVILSATFGHGMLNGSNKNDIVFTIPNSYHKRLLQVPFLSINTREVLESFKYSDDDPYPVDCVLWSCRGFGLNSLIYALSGYSIPTCVKVF